MSRKITNTVLLLFALFILTPSQAQENKRLYRFLITTQYAGSIGFLSHGVGITNNKQTLHYELLYGRVPRRFGGPTEKIMTKVSYYPITVPVNSKIVWKVINPGLFIAKNFGDRFPLVPDRDRYPKGYYWWAPGLRFHLALNTAATIRISKKEDRKLMFYFETNTNERYITTFFSDKNYKTIPFWELWQLGWGVKIML